MTAALHRRDLHELVADRCFPDRGGPDRVGLELELLVFRGVTHGLPTVRVPIEGPDGTRESLDRAARDGTWCRAGGGRELRLVDGGAITFEPGGQVEVSAGVADDVDTALDQLDTTVAALACTFDDDVVLAAAGIDLWTDRGVVAQQLDRARYRTMDAHLAERGPWGAVMMRHSASLQVNLDAGTGARADERWAVANLLAPTCVATFACSPAHRMDADGASSVVSERSIAWQHLDPTRTGALPAVEAGETDRVAAMVDALARADVLLVADGDDVGPGRVGWTFGDWLDGDGPRQVGVADLDVHLTTLFHDVRPRGPLEIRTVDALPAMWRDVPVVLLAGALYDDETASRIRAVLEPDRPRLRQLSAEAARDGLRAPARCATAVEVWSLALAGAARIGVSAARRRRVEDFLDRYTLRGRTVADELADVTRPAAFAACREPRPILDLAADPVDQT